MGAVSHDQTATPPTALGRAAYRTGRLLARAQILVERVPPWLVLGVLVLADWGVMAEIARISVHNGPVYYHGGDSNWYYTTAWELANGRIPFASIGYGFPLVTAPIAKVAGPSFVAGLPAIFAFNFLVLTPIALLCIYGIARMLAGRIYAYLVCVLWVAFPVLVIHYFLADYHTRYVDMTLPAAVGLTDRGDFPSMVLLLVAAYFTLRLATTARDLDALAAGLAIGFAFAVKPSNILFAPAPALALLVARRYRGMLIAAAATVPCLVSLAIWKHRGLGYVPAFSSSATGLALAAVAVTLASIHLNLHRYVPINWHIFRENLDGFREYTWSQRMVYLTTIGGLVGLLRRSTVAGVLVGTWLAVFLVVKGSHPGSDFAIGGFFSHLVPAFPAYFLLVASLPFLLPFYGRRDRRPTPRYSSRALPVVASGVLGVITLAGLFVVTLLPTSARATTADVETYGFFLVPIDTFHLDAKVVGNSVHLRWPSAGPGGNEARYAVLRTAGNTDQCPRIPRSSGACSLQADVVGSVPGTVLSTVDRPPPGTWTYRIGQSVSADSANRGNTDFSVLSTPVRVRVPAGR
jgi:hypothetical protein